MTLSLGVVLSLVACSSERPRAAESGEAATFETLSGACGSDGATRQCHVNLGQHEGIVDCFMGVQECRGGEWSACGGADVTIMSSHVGVASGQSDLSVKSLTGGAGIGTCTSDPCNPYCRVASETTAATATGGSSVAYTYSASEWGNAPGGFVGKQDCSPACGTGFPKSCNGAPTHYNKFDACQADHHCDTTTGGCVKNQSPATWTWPAATCPGIDLTVSPSCVTGGVEGFNICNRGNTAMTVAQGPIKVYVTTGNGYDFGSSSTCVNKAASCSIALTAPLAPGACRRVVASECPAWGNGNDIAYVNSTLSVPECGGTVSSTSATMPGCNNNWSDIKKGGTACTNATTGGFVAATTTQTFTGTCPVGTQMSWNKMLYDLIAPAGTSVSFDVQVTDILPSGSAGTSWPSASTFQNLVVVTTTTNCSATGPSGCPFDLSTALGGYPKAQYEKISIRTTLTPDATAVLTPTLNSWSITYDCKPSE